MAYSTIAGVDRRILRTLTGTVAGFATVTSNDAWAVPLDPNIRGARSLTPISERAISAGRAALLLLEHAASITIEKAAKEKRMGLPSVQHACAASITLVREMAMRRFSFIVACALIACRS